MIQYHITITSKNKNSIKDFFLFLNKNFKNFNIITKYLKKKKSKKVLTILKSPHVNKKAQEQFETRLFTSQISVYYSKKNLLALIFLKKIKTYLFPDIKIKIKFTINKLLLEQTKLKAISPDNFKLNFFHQQLKNKKLKSIKNYNNKLYSKKKINLKQTQYLLQILDTYGSLIKLCLDSSVGRAKD